MTLEELAAKFAESEAKNKELAETVAKLTAAKPEDKKPDPIPENKSLNQKVEDDKQAKDLKEKDAKKLEAALSFNLLSDKFKEEHKSILPKDMTEIFAQAEKEKYDSPIDKANDTKSALIQSFFKIQANIDFLTPNQKSDIDDYLKLSKAGKSEKADEVYRNVFEPALSLLKQIKKVEELAKLRNGHSSPDDTDKMLTNKLIAASKSHHLGEKSNVA